jgi:hypothetical protein
MPRRQAMVRANCWAFSESRSHLESESVSEEEEEVNTEGHKVKFPLGSYSGFGFPRRQSQDLVCPFCPGTNSIQNQGSISLFIYLFFFLRYWGFNSGPPL